MPIDRSAWRRDGQLVERWSITFVPRRVAAEELVRTFADLADDHTVAARQLR